MSKKLNLLIIDDNREFIEDFSMLMSDKYNCSCAESAEKGEKLLDSEDIDVLLLDINLGSGKDGLTLLREVKDRYPYLPVIMITADDRVSTVVNAMKLGASNYIGKNPDLEQFHFSLEKAIHDVNLIHDRDLYRDEINRQWRDMIGDSPAMQKVKDDIKRAAAVKCNVLITGESGTGKELVARAIHNQSNYSDNPFIAVNCAAIPKDLFESEMFGHEKGSFTGAVSRKIGKFEQARKGTVFLDEISEISIEQQAKLLRILQENIFTRVGGTVDIVTEARVIASSNRDLKKEIDEGKFREDLFYRLKVFEIATPPLRDRKSDIPELVRHFLNKKSLEMKIAPPEISEDAIKKLTQYQWPGNVRELEHCVASAIVRCDGGKIESSSFDSEYGVEDFASYSSYEEAKKAHEDKFKRDYIGSVLKATGGNVSEASRRMGVSRQGLIKMMKACGLQE